MGVKANIIKNKKNKNVEQEKIIKQRSGKRIEEIKNDKIKEQEIIMNDNDVINDIKVNNIGNDEIKGNIQKKKVDTNQQLLNILKQIEKKHIKKMEQQKIIKQRSEQRIEKMKKDKLKQQNENRIRDELRNKIHPQIMAQVESVKNDPISLIKMFYPKTGINHNSSTKDILKAFTRSMANFHPDRTINKSIAVQIRAEEIFKLLSTAKEQLQEFRFED